MTTEKQIQSLLKRITQLEKENSTLKQLLNIHNIPINLLKESFDNREIKIRKRMQIFRSLFRGREDVYAYHWTDKKGQTNYSPAKVGKSPTKHYLPLTDQVIYDHLSGKQTIGVYPLLKDNTSWFLAVDFDKGAWQEEARMFLDVCKEHSIPAYTEISRSGNGCHVWIFFKEPIPAVLTRKLGKQLLSKVMEKGKNIDSFDRMFPNQDTLREGGIGNLIALPLQYNPRKNGHSVFVDENFKVCPEQWELLASVKKLDINDIKRLMISTIEQEPTIKIIDENADSNPNKITAIFRNEIYIAKKGIPSELILKLTKLASFSNPAYYKAKAQRLSLNNIPRNIKGFEDDGEYLIFPRGCLSEIESLLIDESIEFSLVNHSNSGKAINVEFKGKLLSTQEEAVNTLFSSDNGILSATTGFGKTVVAAALIAKRKVNTLVIVHRKQLMVQWRERLEAFLDMEEKSIGQIGGGKRSPKGKVDIATIQSLNSGGEVKDIVKQYGQVIVDECHHISAFSFESVLKEVEAKYVHGLTATPTRKDGLHPLMTMQCGPIRYKVSAKEQAKVRPFRHVLIPRFTEFKSKDENIHDLYTALVEDKKRNEMIFNDVLLELGKGSTPIILTERREHVLELQSMFTGFAKNIVILMGNLTKQEEESALKELSTLPEEEELLIIATGKYIGEGFDFARLDTMFLTFPFSWKGTLQQYIGRLHRLDENKHEVRVYDYVDSHCEMLQKMYEKRKKEYKALGYVVEDNSSILEDTQQMQLF